MSNWTRRKWRLCIATGGQRAYAPRQIVSILIYAYSRGVFSSRQIEQRCREDLGFMYLAGRNCPNFRVLSDFRKDHGGFFRACFKQTVQLALALGLVSLGHVSLDGSKFKANSSKHKAMSYGRLKEKEQELCEEIEALTRQADRCDEEEDRVYQERTGYELPNDLRDKKQRLKKVREMKQLLEAREQELRPGQKIEDKKQISFADPEARIMKQKGDFEYAYNAQISVDGKSQVIVGQHVSQQANDAREVAPALDEVEETSGRLPEQLSLDNGYYSGNNLQEVSDRQLEAYIATDRGEKRGKGDLDASKRYLVKADFRYDEERDGFHCPGGQLLTLKTTRRTGQRVYQGEIEACRSCPYYRRCCRSKSGAARTIASDGKEPLRRGDERADGATGEPGALRASQDDRGAGVRTDQELGISGIRAAGQGESGGGVLPGLRGAQPQENHFCGTAGRGVSGVREASGVGVKKGRIGVDEVKNRPLIVPFRVENRAKPDFHGFEGRGSMVMRAKAHRP